MSTMASARIPDEIYDQGIDALSRIGSNTTELVISAFAYVIQNESLPYAKKPITVGFTRPSKQQIEEVLTKIECSTLSLNLPDDWDYREELTSGKELEYEALS